MDETLRDGSSVSATHRDYERSNPTLTGGHITSGTGGGWLENVQSGGLLSGQRAEQDRGRERAALPRRPRMTARRPADVRIDEELRLEAAELPTSSRKTRPASAP
jgi:hypothetical protein